MRMKAGTLGCAAAIASLSLIVLVGATTAGGATKIKPKPPRFRELPRAATQVSRAIAANRRQIRRGTFAVIPPGGHPAGIVRGRLAGFPLRGKTFGILSNGDVRFAKRRNTSESTGRGIGGPFLRGARDVTIMRIGLRVPRNATCLSIRFRFLTEEYPEFIGSPFNDFFIAELDDSSWDAGTNTAPRITAPGNFAFDSQGNAISVNSAGAATVTKENAAGTTYDGGTRILRASTQITSGRHLLYLSIADQGDRIFDSAVLLDNLTLDRRTPCQSGVAEDL